MALPKFGAKPSTSPASQVAPPANTNAAHPQGATSTRRRAAATSAPTIDHSSTGVRGEPERKFIEGEYPCYLSAMNHGENGISFTLRVHLPGDEFHGAEATMYLNGKSQSPGAIKKKRREVAEFFNACGFPETTWSADATGNGRVPPVERFFVESVDDGGQIYVVPVMLHGVFSVDVNEADPSKVYQKIVSAKRIEPMLCAPIPKYLPPWMKALGWPGQVEEGKYGPQFVVNLEAAAAEFECWAKASHGQPVYPEDGDDGIPF